MTWLAALGGASFLLVCIVGGARMLLLARRTRQLPEAVLGAGLVLMGGVATPLGALARSPLDLPWALKIACAASQCALLSAGMAGFALFTRRVFRPREIWARGIEAAIDAVMALGVAEMVARHGFDALLRGDGCPGYLAMQTGVLAALAWTSGEALHYAGQLRRRLAFGLADPVVTDRVRLWGLGMLCATLMSVVTVSTQAAGADILGSLAGAAFIGCLGLVAAGTIYLAFLPPRAYTRWVERRAPV
jgi:hypothetical protein